MKIIDRIWLRIGFAGLVLAFGSAGMNVTRAQNSDPVRPRSAASPTPTPVKTPMPTSKPATGSAQTLDTLQASIRQRMLTAEVRRGRVGIKIVSLASGKVVFENDADKYFVPASNMKNFTVAAALERLGPDFRFVTSVYAAGKPDASGVIKGDLRIFGRGDVSISTAFNNGDYYKGLDNLADKIAAAGVKRVEGDLVGDESYFKGFAIPETWEWDDLQWYDGAEISALPINNNALDLSVKPGLKNGPCIVSVLPLNPLMRVINSCVTTAKGVSALKVFKPLGENVLEVSGWMLAGDKGFAGYIAFTRPAELFVMLLKQRLELKGIVVTGQPRVLPQGFRADPAQPEIARLESPPFSEIAAKTMKPSQNMFTETILWTLGECKRSQRERPELPGVPIDVPDSSVLGLDEVKTFRQMVGIPNDTVLQYDGSGMSRHDLITPDAIVTLYTYMAKQSRNAQVWRDSLAVGGVDGTLSRRFLGTAAAGNLRGKTGTLDQVSALSGYLTTKGGEQIVISIIVNGVADPRTRTSLIDDIVVSLANFSGKVD